MDPDRDLGIIMLSMYDVMPISSSFLISRFGPATAAAAAAAAALSAVAFDRAQLRIGPRTIGAAAPVSKEAIRTTLDEVLIVPRVVVPLLKLALP